MTEEGYTGPFGILVVVCLAFAGAVSTSDVTMRLFLIAVGIAVSGVWVYRYLAEREIESRLS